MNALPPYTTMFMAAEGLTVVERRVPSLLASWRTGDELGQLVGRILGFNPLCYRILPCPPPGEFRNQAEGDYRPVGAVDGGPYSHLPTPWLSPDALFQSVLCIVRYLS